MTALSADERQELAQSVRSACERLASEDRVRAVAYGEGDRGGADGHSGFDTVLWDVLCNQVGVAAIALPEHLGGAGYGASALGVVAHELGRALAPVPFVELHGAGHRPAAGPDRARPRRGQATHRAHRRSPHCRCGSHRRRRVVASVRGDAARRPHRRRLEHRRHGAPRAGRFRCRRPRRRRHRRAMASRRCSCSTRPSTASSPRLNAYSTAPDRWPPSR